MISEALKSRKLTLHQQEFGIESAKQLAKMMLSKNRDGFYSLDVSKNPLGNPGIFEISKGLNSASLVHLEIGSCDMTDLGAKSLFQAISKN